MDIQSDTYDESFEQSAFLNAFSKYQVNNPYRSNTIKVNFFPLVLNVINYLDEKYQIPASRNKIYHLLLLGETMTIKH